MKHFDIDVIAIIVADKIVMSEGRLEEGRLELFDLIRYVTRDEFAYFQIPRLIDEIRPVVLEMHPNLEGMSELLEDLTAENVVEKYDLLVETYGESLPVRKLKRTEHLVVPAMVEASRIVDGGTWHGRNYSPIDIEFYEI
jgi:hypothetical protein